MTIIGPDISLIYSLLTAKCIDLSLLIDYSTYFRDVIQFGEQGWRSGESTRLPLIWPGFNSRRRRHMWVKFVVDLSLAPRGFSPCTPVFPSPQKLTFPNSNSTRNQVDEEPMRGCAILLLSVPSGLRLIEVFNNRN